MTCFKITTSCYALPLWSSEIVKFFPREKAGEVEAQRFKGILASQKSVPNSHGHITRWTLAGLVCGKNWRDVNKLAGVKRSQTSYGS